MASRYFFALCALALIVGIASAPVEEVEGVDDEVDENVEKFIAGLASDHVDHVEVEDVEVDEDVERFWQGIAIWAAGEGASWLSKEFIKVKVKCFPDVFKHCDFSPIKHPEKYYNCADQYFQANAKRCLND